MHLKLVPFDRAIMPDVHYEEKGSCNHEGDPTSLVNLEKYRGEVGTFYEERRDGEEDDENPMATPY